ncbi:hypothetical protein [Amycolatopsis sp. FDAARGOS 1241]|uniref:hypothetical protein n=1 Tax=Amycolatopsis sp. FDAARGOS 1241 TaxID=2778070 RepID=UPI00194FBF85|nr:hypothetical protein [Amycolatopsis sp. FDAARGOS 1241]QRP46904.1 hypothetical protein I6J71_02295 [Amycolatopsis sp. FDAARGOS 1241]
MERTASGVPMLTAFRLSEERAAARYLVARKEMVRLATRVASVRQLVVEQPLRADYRAVLRALEAAHSDAVRRTRLAYERWHGAQLRSDAHWTATSGKAA